MATPDATSQLLKSLGQIAGIGGIAFGVFLLIFQGIIGIRKLFPQLTQQDAYRLLRLMVVICAIVVLSGIIVYGIGNYRQNGASISSTPTPTPTPTPVVVKQAGTTPNPTSTPDQTCIVGTWVEVRLGVAELEDPHEHSHIWTFALEGQPAVLTTRRDDGKVAGHYHYDQRSDSWIGDVAVRGESRAATLKIKDKRKCTVIESDRKGLKFIRQTLPPGCKKHIGSKCTEYSFPVVLHGPERTRQVFTLTGLSKGDTIRASFKGTVLPDKNDTANNGTSGDIAVVLRPVFGLCQPGAACMGRHPYPGTERNWPPLEAHYQLEASNTEEAFEIEINFCSYEGNAKSICSTGDDAVATFIVFPLIQN